MFDHILGYTPLIARLRAHKEMETWPKALVFAGAPATGRMTLALESARVLLCEKSGGQNCHCGSCIRHSLLQDTQLIVSGSRSTIGDIQHFLVLLTSLEKQSLPDAVQARSKLPDTQGHRLEDKSATVKKMFLRRLAIFLKRFDRGSISDRKKKLIASSYAPLFECLHTDLGEAFPISFEKIGQYIEQLAKYQDPDIDSMRMVQELCQFASKAQGKVLILENLQDFSMPVMHSMLKFTEESPKDLTIIASSRGRMLHAQNLASRFQWISLPMRSNEEQKLVCKRYFDAESDTLDSLFLGTKESALLSRLCESFIADLHTKEHNFWNILHSCAKEQEQAIALLFLKKLPTLLRQLPENYNKKTIVQACKDAIAHVTTRNIEARSALEGVYSIVHY